MTRFGPFLFHASQFLEHQPQPPLNWPEISPPRPSFSCPALLTLYQFAVYVRVSAPLRIGRTSLGRGEREGSTRFRRPWVWPYEI